MNKVFWVQHEKLDQSSYLFLNDEKLESLETAQAENALNLIINTKGMSSKKIFKNHSTLKEIRFFEYGYVIAGHLIDRDEKGRRIVYNCFIPSNEIDTLDSYILDIVQNKLQKEIHIADLNKIKRLIKKKKLKTQVIALFIISIIITIIIIYFT